MLEMDRLGFSLVWFGIFPCLKKKCRGKYWRGKTVGEKTYRGNDLAGKNWWGRDRRGKGRRGNYLAPTVSSAHGSQRKQVRTENHIPPTMKV